MEPSLCSKFRVCCGLILVQISIFSIKGELFTFPSDNWALWYTSTWPFLPVFQFSYSFHLHLAISTSFPTHSGSLPLLMTGAIIFPNSQWHLFPQEHCHSQNNFWSLFWISSAKDFSSFQKTPHFIFALCVREHRSRLTLRRWRVLVWYTVAPILTAHPAAASMIHCSVS